MSEIDVTKRMEQIHNEQFTKYRQMILDLRMLELQRDELLNQINMLKDVVQRFEIEFGIIQQIRQIINQEYGEPSTQNKPVGIEE